MTFNLFVMEISTWAFVLFLSLAANSSSPEILQEELVSIGVTNAPTPAEEVVIGSIVVEDIIAIVDTGNSSNHVTGFTVYNSITHAAVYSSGSCGGSCCSYDLGSLSSDTYYAIATTSQGGNIQDSVIIP